MKVFSFYNKDSGELHRARFHGSEDLLESNTPVDHLPIEGAFDCMSQRMDLQTMTMVDYQPAAPDAFHEWDATSRRWKPTPEHEARLAEDAIARQELDNLDRKTLRALLEAHLNIKHTQADRDAGAMTPAEIHAAKESMRSKILK